MSRGLNNIQKEEVVISYNKLAMEQLQTENFEHSMSYLKQALIGIKSITDEMIKGKLMAITFNNLGCLFKRTRNYSEALKYLYKAVDLESKLPYEAATIAGAHLNICSILSQQTDHVKAIRHGLRSIFLLKSIHREQPKHIPTLIIAYHNVSSEYQLLGQLEDAEDCLCLAMRLSNQHLGPQHSLTATIKKALAQISNSQSPGFDYLAKVTTPKAPTPRVRLPIVSAKSRQSRATSNESRKSLYREGRNRVTERGISQKGGSNPSRTKTKIIKQFEIQTPFIPKIFNEEEASIKTDKSFSSINSSFRKIDLQQHKATERMAAIMIQAHWRGYVARKRFTDLKMRARLKQAELKARRAVEEYEKLKQQANKKKNIGK